MKNDPFPNIRALQIKLIFGGPGYQPISPMPSQIKPVSVDTNHELNEPNHFYF